ncbi:MAG: 16S rRNA (cytosine(1402)-N(4))-methyltransferase, partial [Succinivibrio sp.]
MAFTHIPVLLNEVLDGLDIRPSGIYVDATFGRGGHSRKILERLDDEGRLYGLDRDLSAVEAAKSIEDKRFTMTH